MQLHGFFNSSTSYRVRIALALKGIAFDTVPVDLRAGRQHAPAHLALSPAAAVPVLVDGQGNALTQSLAILGHLDRQVPEPPLYPADPLLRARVEEVVQLIACDLHPLNNLRVLQRLAEQFGADLVQRQAWYAHWVEVGLGAVETLLQRHASGPYCFGDHPGAADCCLVPQVANALRQGCDLDAFPRVMSVYRACVRHPAFMAAAPERQPDYVSP